MTAIDYIRMKLPETEVLAQLAEESAELSQAALKLRRALDGRNKTPVFEDAARNNLFEEISDVANCLKVLGFNVIPMDEDKIKRWATRL